ncbi:disease resistance protein UNI-like [Carya illinoinensis]|uniref:disease resistance protein UNI-like n=1 Tax=Carya illinoinensis TaxID=32201 RepID=UPI001C71EDCE|nr:disease resistance protein UNI-like [Carya illinoinensis]XP_042964892.1 disease resistance protein UNI-like [Carya illinoinensis]XP_042964893.1 disease resistance protein UNI-like [Carya illinoinensis]XP_042964894.1 disease resistance protein UNI-like [Carya illinoinensis]XP_042964895.1 disease resistance protein UNI-like [Carya illinoinensis]XP_042964896.1 disease resistance protein UNI-like [Carya illinoinensis]XP_042964897.1 disease resistance protein UNI-like [Carya illinoinensis]XP_0
MEIISSIVEKIVDYSVGPIGEQFDYIISCKSNIKDLEKEFPKLLEKKEAVQQSVDGAQWNQEVVASEVKTWLTNVEKQIEEVHKFLEEDVKTNRMCLNGWCPDLKLRYSLGKKAQKNTRAIIKLLEEGRKYDRVYNIAPPLKVTSSSTDRFKDFESRKSMIQNVLEALRDDKIDMIALCGMGGIGKTEMAKEIARRVQAESLFEKVAIAVVSQSPNLTKIQGELADMLGKRLDVEGLYGRADELHSRLMNNKRVLVILDDVWEQLDLEAIGVYYAVKEKHCKILLTSRNEDTCNQMGIQKIFQVGLLSEEEAWNLFREMAGACINTPNLISIAKQVAEECGRLPIAIATVGSALSNKSDEYEWKTALQQLKMSIPQYITGMHPKVYSSIEFSYNYLGTDEAKSCFLLCCLYPDDYDIPVEHLVRYRVAKRFLKVFGTVEQTRAHVHAIVRNLRRSNLLLDSERYESVKMHDIVRDVAISIASRDQHGFMVELDRRLVEWPQKDDSYTTISLLLGEMKGHPDGLKCPKLQLLRLSCLKDSETLPGNFFNGMNELKMLYLEEGCFSLKSLPSSIQILENLLMLNLESCRLGDVSAIGTLGKLEILSFCGSEIEELPREIGNLSQLKLLDMKGCDSLKRIAAGVLSRLSHLQELYIANFKNWEYTTTMEGNGEGTSNNASLAELISRFGQMTVLEISVPSIECLPKELHFRNSNLRFRINIEDDETYLFENAIRLEEREDASDLGKVLLENRGVFGNLKHCYIFNCQYSENIFWLAMVRDLVQLKSLRLFDCENIQEVFSKEGDQDKKKVIGDIITLPNLEKIYLSSLPRLTGICKSMDSVEVERGGGSTSSTTLSHKLFSSNTILWFPNLVKLHVKECESLQVIFDLEGLKVIENHHPVLALSQLTSLELWNLDGMAHVWKNIPRGFQGFQNLVSIDIDDCKNLRSLLPATVAKLLVQLQTVKIWTCQSMENIIEREDEGGEEIGRANIIVFPQIHTFGLRWLENLVSFNSEAHSFEWPSIKNIELYICPKFKTFGSEIQSGRKLRKKDAKLDARAPQEPSIGSSSASTRESSRLLNRCLELSCVPRRRNSNPDQRNCSSSLGENKHNFNKDQVKLTNQDEPNVSETENQTKMCSLFPYYLIESLGNLEELDACECDSLEVIFELDEGLRDLEESNYIFNNLTELKLMDLQKLLHIWKKGPRDIKGFNNLRFLTVSECHSLKCLFTSSIAKLLVKLEDIQVWHCNEMKEIIAKESGDEEKRDHVIAFPQVKTLRLVHLPKLECFCNEAIAFIWPSLEKITIARCEKLKMFVPTTSMKTPKLQGVHTESETFQPMIEGDLNTTIQHIIKGKANLQENLQEISKSSRSP